MGRAGPPGIHCRGYSGLNRKPTGLEPTSPNTAEDARGGGSAWSSGLLGIEAPSSPSSHPRLDPDRADLGDIPKNLPNDVSRASRRVGVPGPTRPAFPLGESTSRNPLRWLRLRNPGPRGGYSSSATPATPATLGVPPGSDASTSIRRFCALPRRRSRLRSPATPRLDPGPARNARSGRSIDPPDPFPSPSIDSSSSSSSESGSSRKYL